MYSHSIVQGSFKATGVWPIDMCRIDESVFGPALAYVDHPDENTATQNTEDQEQPNGVSHEKEIVRDPFSDHPTKKSLDALESSLSSGKLVLFKTRWEDGNDGPDHLFQSWKILKKGWEDIKSGLSEVASSSTEGRESILGNVLVYPKIIRKSKRQNKKADIPKHLTCQKALLLLEQVDKEKQKKTTRK